MKKFSQYQVEKVNENKMYDKYLELSDGLANIIIDYVQENTGADLTNGSPELDEELHDMITEISESIIHKAMDM